jgi:urea transport system substrate-binding protein
LRLDILFSTSGDYGVLGRDCRDGAMVVIKELRGACLLAIEPIFGDPGGSRERYIELARKMLLEDGSQARKNVIPVVEKHDALLWYVAPLKASRPIRM